MALKHVYFKVFEKAVSVASEERDKNSAKGKRAFNISTAMMRVARPFFDPAGGHARYIMGNNEDYVGNFDWYDND